MSDTTSHDVLEKSRFRHDQALTDGFSSERCLTPAETYRIFAHAGTIAEGSTVEAVLSGDLTDPVAHDVILEDVEIALA